MSWKKWIGIGILGFLTGGIFLYVYVWYRVFKKIGHLYWEYILLPALYLWYLLLFRIPVFLFIQWPLYAAGKTAKKIGQLVEAVETYMIEHSRRIGILFGVIFLTLVGLGPESLTYSMGSVTLGAFAVRTVTMAVLSFGSTILLVVLYNLLKSIDIAQGSLSIKTEKLPGVAPAAGAAAAASGAAEKGKQLGRKAVGGARKADRKMNRMEEKAETAQGVYDDIETPGDATSQLFNSRTMRAASGYGVDTLVGALSGVSGSSVIIVILAGLALLLMMVAYAVILSLFAFVVIGAIILPFYFFVIKILGTFVISPLLNAVGAGGAWANYFGQTASNQYFAGIGEIGAVEQTSAMLGQTAAKIGCFAKGPACYRQWQLNNTKRPGSEDVGEQYGLKIENLQVGQGSGLDVAYKDTDYAVPVSFTLSNPRHGLKGLNARDVKYRLKVIDASRQGENAYCDTGWIQVNAFDLPDDGDDDSNDIYPGTSASTGFQTVTDPPEGGDPFTIEGCKMLQPALGSHKTVMLEVKYDYFSQSTLYFRAMSLENFRSNPNIEKKVKKSKTADTPVKAAINVNSPVLYDRKDLQQGGSPEDAAQPFAVRASLDTEEFDLRYRVNDLTVRNSQETGIYKRGAEGEECQFKEPDSEGKMGLKTPAEENIIFDESSERELWFTSSQKPPIFGCVMYLKDPRDISPSGETLTMGVESDYTVALEERIGSFNVYNSRCSPRLDCPLLVTANYAYGKGDFYNSEKETRDGSEKRLEWKIECSGIDAGNGCSVVEGPGGREDKEWEKNLMTGNDVLDRELESGEIAVDAAEISQGPGVDISEGAVGLRPRFIRRYTNGKMKEEAFAVVSISTDNGKDVEKVKLDTEAPCNSEKWSGEGTPIIYYPPGNDGKKCQKPRRRFTWSGEESGFSWFFEYED